LTSNVTGFPEIDDDPSGGKDMTTRKGDEFVESELSFPLPSGELGVSRNLEKCEMYAIVDDQKKGHISKLQHDWARTTN
jgi:hypothetical protein